MTLAGKRLLKEYPGVWYWSEPEWGDRPIGEAIESEAVAAERARIRAAVEDAYFDIETTTTSGSMHVVRLERVLAAIGETGPHPGGIEQFQDEDR